MDYFVMITGKHFSNSQIAELEAKYLNGFYNDEHQNPILYDAANYYAILFQTFLHGNRDKVFKKMSKTEQQNIYKSQDTKFKRAMQYSFNKGHQNAFAVLLIDSREAQEFDKTFFENPNSKLWFIYNFEKMFKKGVTEKNLNRDKNEMLIKETRRHFEGGYEEIMYFAKIFYKKGADLAFEQIRKNIVGVKYKIRGRTRLLDLPYNQEMEVTPAFTATYGFEQPGYEEWDVHWDATYGYKASKELIAKFKVHQFSVKEIQAYSSVGAIAYKMIEEQLSDGLSDDDIIYLGEINFILIPPIKQMRFIEHTEIEAIQTSLTLTLSRRLRVSADHILVTTT